MSSPNQHPRRLFMPLFTDNLPRTALIAFGAFLVSYYFGSYINTSSAFQVTQTVLALFAIASIILFVALHHRQEGRLFSQQQEEFLLIVGTALIGFGKHPAQVRGCASDGAVQRSGSRSVNGLDQRFLWPLFQLVVVVESLVLGLLWPRSTCGRLYRRKGTMDQYTVRLGESRGRWLGIGGTTDMDMHRRRMRVEGAIGIVS